MTSTVLYESDFYNWTVEQVKSLRLGKLDSLDLENLAEEIESLGNQKRSELENRLAVLLGHLLKWDLQPNLRGKSWRSSVVSGSWQLSSCMTSPSAIVLVVSAIIFITRMLPIPTIIWNERE